MIHAFFFFFFLESAFIERYRQVLVPRRTVLQLSKTVRMSVVGTGSCKMCSQVLRSLVVIWFGEHCGPKAKVEQGGLALIMMSNQQKRKGETT
jgi:hypothetical protein